MSDFDIEKIAKLALLELTSEEMEQFRTQMPMILDYVGKLQEVNTDNVDPKAYLTEETNVFAQDEIGDCTEDIRKRVRGEFPSEKGGALQVPAIFE